MNIRSILLALLAATLFVSKATATDVENAEPVKIEDTALHQFVHQDRGYTYDSEPRFHSDLYGLETRMYTVATQEWQGHQLYNRVYVAVPNGVSKDVTHALVLVAGGSFRDEYLLPPSDREKEKFNKRLLEFALIANQLQTPIIVVRNVPFQPLSLCPKVDPNPIREDALIACTFQKNLDSGDNSWPALFPMTKSVSIALDFAQEVFAAEWGMNIETFTATGASKRGWTTFLTAAVDDRITGAIPMVIDMLNMQAHLDLQVAAWGTHSLQIQDYDTYGFISRMDTERGTALVEMVDPLSYAHEYDMPMLLILGANDEYWPVDSANLYYQDLGSDTHVLYLPNEGHDAKDYNRVLPASKALHTRAGTGVRLPDMGWEFGQKDETLTVSFSSDIQPREVNLWSAQSSDRDFRDSLFEPTSICHSGTCQREHEIVVETDADLCEVFYVEAWFEHDGIDRYPLTTTLHVTGKENCLPTQQLAE